MDSVQLFTTSVSRTIGIPIPDPRPSAHLGDPYQIKTINRPAVLNTPFLRPPCGVDGTMMMVRKRLTGGDGKLYLLHLVASKYVRVCEQQVCFGKLIAREVDVRE